MREVKFRAWDKVNKEMVEIDGSCLYLAEGKIYEIYEQSYCNETYMGKKDVSDRYEPLEYTGLKDKNGKEMYEGDIVRYSYFPPYGELNEFISEVEFDIDKIIITKKSANTWYFLSSMSEHCEVIENKYANPELLE